MPAYDFRCNTCRRTVEVTKAMSDPDPRCECGGTMTRLFSPVGITFKGGGFYKTDSRKARTTG